jgi:hypothetical protein
MICNIGNKEEQEYLLGDMIVPENRGSASIFDQLRHLKHVLIDMPTIWSIIDIPLKKEYTMLYKSEYGTWSHGNRNTGTHNNLGMAFAWYMLNKNIFSKIELTDSPDFHAVSEIKNINDNSQIDISGDIGRCTTIAIMQGLQRLENIHDLWISVLDWFIILVVEFLYSPSVYYNYKLRTMHRSSKLLPFYLNNFTDKELAEIFYCTYCNQWAIQDESLKELKSSTWE